MKKSRKYKPADLVEIRTEPLAARPSLVRIEQSATLTEPGATAAQLLGSLPDILAARNFRELVRAIVEARRGERPVIMAMGAHIIKCALSGLVVDLMERGIVSALVTTGAAAVHDYELAAAGHTSEDVAERLTDGSFGAAAETAQVLNEAAVKGSEKGLGRALGELIRTLDLPYAQSSIFAHAARLELPATVHVAVGTDVVHMHPVTDGAALGAATLTDFRLLVSVVSDLEGGVYLNFGSAVVLPEVFLKSLSAARNLGAHVENFTTADFDMIRHYRPTQNVVRRPGGSGYSFSGHHEIMLPLLRQSIIDLV